MEEAWKLIFIHSPMAGVLLFAMIFFMSHISRKDKTLQEVVTKHGEMLEKWRVGYDEQLERSGVIISENSKALGAIASTLQHIGNRK